MKYFVSYFIINGYSWGIGNGFVSGDYSMDNEESIRRVLDDLKRETNAEELTLINYKEVTE